MKKTAKIFLAISLALCLLSGIFASVYQSSFNTVEVEDFNVIIENGSYVNGQLYIPKDASEDNKLPFLVFLHGNFNNYSMQDQNAIELSRRGFVVMITDNFNMGNSSITEPGAWDMSQIRLMIEYATSCYNFIDTEKIGIYGHSLGGYVAHDAVQYYLTQQADGGECKISAILDAGNDPVYEPYTDEKTGKEIDLAINWGVIAGKWDEWCYTGETGNPSLYLSSDAAKSFVNQLDGVELTGDVENGHIYKGNIDGKEYRRVVYQISGIHPMNHFSSEGAAAAIEFFYDCFGVPSGHEYIESSDQIWQMKELFNCVGLIGIFLFLFPFGSMLINGTSYFAELKSGEVLAAPRLTTKKSKAVHWIDYAINCALPALLFFPIAWKLVAKSNWIPGTDWGPSSTVPHWFGQPNTNELAAWSAIVGVVLFIIFVVCHKIADKDAETIPQYWGLRCSARKVWKSFILALAVVAGAYVILYTVEFFFNVDFRIWVLAMRVFTVRAAVYALAYAPAFIVFYLVNSVLVNGGNNVEERPEWQILLLSCVANIIGIVVIIAIQYITFTSTGSLVFNAMRVVNLFPLVVLIPVGTIVSRQFYKETGNVYAGSFVVGILYTLMTVANTSSLGTVLHYWG